MDIFDSLPLVDNVWDKLLIRLDSFWHQNKPEQAKVRLSMIVQWKIQKIQFKTGFCTSKSQAISKITQKPEFVFGEVTQPFYIIIKPEFLSGGSHNFLYSHKSITSLWDFTQLQIKEMTLSIWTDQKKSNSLMPSR